MSEQTLSSTPGPLRVLFALYTRDIVGPAQGPRPVLRPRRDAAVAVHVRVRVRVPEDRTGHRPGAPCPGRPLVLDDPGAWSHRGGDLFQGIQAVALPLVQEFSYSKEIEDRVLAPAPVWTVGLAKILSGATQSMLGGGDRLPGGSPGARQARGALGRHS